MTPRKKIQSEIDEVVDDFKAKLTGLMDNHNLNISSIIVEIPKNEPERNKLPHIELLNDGDIIDLIDGRYVVDVTKAFINHLKFTYVEHYSPSQDQH